MPPIDVVALHKSLYDKLTDEILGDGAGTYATGPNPEPAPLTFESLQKIVAAFGPHPPPPVRLIEVEPIPIYGPARWHRRRRIRKKWAKRYGLKIVRYEYPMGDNVLIDEKRGVGYCHPHAARIIRARTTEGKSPNYYR